MAQDIETRHQRECRSRKEGRCNCRPSYRASVWLPREKKRIRKNFLSLAEARSWRTDALSAVNKGTLRAPSAATLKQALVITNDLEGGLLLDGAGPNGLAPHRAPQTPNPASLSQALRMYYI